jgi:hypothetical protein
MAFLALERVRLAARCVHREILEFTGHRERLDIQIFAGISISTKRR